MFLNWLSELGYTAVNLFNMTSLIDKTYEFVFIHQSNEIGNCYGMSHTSIMYLHDENLIPVPYHTTYELTELEAMPNIIEIQLDQDWAGTRIFWLSVMNTFGATGSFPLSNKLNYMKASMAQGNTTIGILINKNTSAPNHAIVCIGFEDNGQTDSSTIYIYDVNYPDDADRNITISPYLGDYRMEEYNSSGNTFSDIAFIDPLDIPLSQASVIEELNERHNQHIVELLEANRTYINSYRKNQYTQRDPVDFFITDNYNRILGWVNGVFINEITGSLVQDSLNLGVEVSDTLVCSLEYVSPDADTVYFATTMPTQLDENAIYCTSFDSAAVISNSILSYTFGLGYVSLLSLDLDGNGITDSTINFAIDTTLTVVPPNAPQNLSGSIISQRHVTLNWVDMSSSEFGFNIYDSTFAFGEFKIIGIVSANCIEYTDTMFTASTDHYFKVYAFNAGGISEPSNILPLTTPPMPIPALISPEDSVIFIGEGVTVIWSPVIDAVHYHLQVTADNSFSELNLDIDTLTTTEFLLPDLATIYGWNYWRVRAADCVSNWSDWSEVRTFNMMSAFSITLTPADTLIQIPSTGGSFDYNIEVANNTVSAANVDIWCDVTLPNGNPYGPVLGPVNLTLPAGFSGDRDRTQVVPGAAPMGNYSFNGYVGIFPDSIWASDSFPFDKLATGDGEWIESWDNFGEPFEEWLLMMDQSPIPDVYSLEQNYPNPFNPYTTFRFGLPESGRVELTLYNILGQQVLKLVDGYRQAGYHEVTWNASSLSSGMYFFKLKAGNFTSVKKTVLLK